MSSGVDVGVPDEAELLPVDGAELLPVDEAGVIGAFHGV